MKEKTFPLPPQENEFDTAINLLSQMKNVTQKQKIKNIQNDFKKLEKLSDIGKYEIFLNPFKKKFSFERQNIDGYIFYRKLNRKWVFLGVTNFSDIYKIISKKYAYIIDKIIGHFEDGKPFLMLDEHIPITLNLSAKSNIQDENKNFLMNGKDLCYDAKAFYLYLDIATLKNLTPQEATVGFDLWGFIKSWWWVILIFVGIMLLLFLTPFGKDLLLKIMPQNLQETIQSRGG
jgi:hypothetical protein